MLLERPGEVVTREELRSRLWPADTFVDFDRGLNNAILRLRNVLSDSAEKPRYIETLPRRGYRFIASVDNSQLATAEPFPAGEIAHERIEKALPNVAVTEPLQVPRRRLWVAAVALAIIGTSLLVGLAVTWRRPFSAASSVRIQSIAVLPLENLTGDPGQEYFVDGMTDALITDLAQIRALRVISRTSVMRYKQARKSLPEIARELSVDAILEGSVVRSKDQVRIDAQLIQAANDQHLWAKSYQRQLRDVVTMQNEIASAVAEAVQLQISPQEKAHLTASRPVNPDAYEDYLRGRYYGRKWTSEATEKAFQFFQKATVEDPNYALAYAGLAEAEYRRPLLEPIPTRQAMPLAAQAAMKALELDESLAEAHAALADIKYRFDWDWEGADAEFKRALQLNSSYADSDSRWQYIIFLRTMNRYQEAINEAKRAKELDPVLSDRRAGMGGAYFFGRQYDLAVGELRQVVARYPEGALAYSFLGMAYEQKGQSREAIAALEQCVAISRGDPLYQASLAHAYATFGRKQEARKILAELRQRAKREYVSPYNIAVVWLSLGNKEEALTWLKKAYADRSFLLVIINSSPWFDPLRSDPRFQSLVRRIGLDPQRAIPN